MPITKFETSNEDDFTLMDESPSDALSSDKSVEDDFAEYKPIDTAKIDTQAKPSSSLFGEVEKSQQPKGPSWFDSLKLGAKEVGKTIVKGAAETVLQPARFLERTGKAIGTLGQTPEQKARFEAFMGPGLQEVAGGKEYATPAYKTPQEVAGGAIQAAANLATPFVKNPLGIGLQSGALSAGKATEEGKDLSEIAAEGALGTAAGYGLGKFSKAGGEVMAKGKQAIKENFKPALKKVFPLLTNVSKSDTQWALKNADKVIQKIKTYVQADEMGDAASGISAIRQEIADKASTIVSQADKAAKTNYDTVTKPIFEKYATARGDVDALKGSLLKAQNEIGHAGIGTEAKDARAAINEILTSHTDDSAKGFKALRQKLYGVIEATDEGSVEHRLATKVWDDAGKQLEKMTGGELKAPNAEYSKFKDSMKQLRPLWSSKANEDTRRNFAMALESQAKGGSMDALKQLEEIAGLRSGELADEVKAVRIAKMMNLEKAPTGSRMRDVLMSGIFGGGGATLGSVFGPTGTLIGGTAGMTLGTKLTSPKALSKMLFDELKQQSGGKMPGAVRKWLGAKIADPKFAQALMLMHQGNNKSEPETTVSQTQDQE